MVYDVQKFHKWIKLLAYIVHIVVKNVKHVVDRILCYMIPLASCQQTWYVNTELYTVILSLEA